MFSLFKNFKKGVFACQKSGVCTQSPVLNALDAVILNEVRQIAFYMVKLKEFGISNHEILKEAICALSVNITDVDFDKKAFKNFFLQLKNTKDKTHDFYIKKSLELNIPYESINPVFELKTDDFDISDLIKSGENLIKQFNLNTLSRTSALVEVIILISKCASIQLFKLMNFTDEISSYGFEILRLLTLTNNILTREEKLIRRIKEFSEILYKINNNLVEQREIIWGKRTSAEICIDTFKGKSILVTGGGLEELYKVLVQTENENINVYVDISLVTAFSYPAFKEFKHFKGLYGLNEPELDFSNFKGVILSQSNSNRQLGNIFRGKIFTTKKIPFDKAVKIDICDISSLIEAANETEGFEEEIHAKNEIKFIFDKDGFIKTVKNAEDKEIFLTAGMKNTSVEEKFQNAVKIDFFPPDEFEILYLIIENAILKNLNIYFSVCSKESIYTVLSILNKGIKNIFIADCEPFNVSPHIIAALKNSFNIKEI